MNNQLLSICAAFVAFSIFDLSKAFQKIGLAKARESRRAGMLIWAGATASTYVSSVLLLVAVSQGSVLIVGAMGGSGLAVLALFSVFVMKESVSRREIIGILAILFAPVLLALFQRSGPSAPMIRRLLLLSAILSVAYSMALVITRRSPRFRGLLFGGFSGGLGGLILLYQKVTTTGYGRSISWIKRLDLRINSPFINRVLELMVNPYAVTWIALSLASLVILQFAYKHDRAIRIVPTFAANYILVPVIGGPLCFGENLHPVQWGGIALILAGVVLISGIESWGTGTDERTNI